MSRLTYVGARHLVVAGGTALLAFLAVIAWAQGVDPPEAVGLALYMPVFLAAILLGFGAGVGVALAAGAIYVALRIPEIHVVGLSRLSGVLGARVGSYLVLGAVIGLAASRLNTSLSHLERHDMVDDATGLHNAKWFLEATDAEMNRVERALDPERGFLGYGSMFSVVVVSVPAPVFEGRERSRLLMHVGEEMAKGLRRSDRPVHAVDQAHLFALLLPGTGRAGATLVAERAVSRLQEAVGDTSLELPLSVIAYPDDPDLLTGFRERLQRIDAAEHVPA